MKNLASILAFTLMTITPALMAQDFPDVDKSPMDMSYYPSRAAFRNFAETAEERDANKPQMRIVYSRPQVKGRKIFGSLIKFGEMWRIGANEATEIQFMQDVKIANQPVKAGRYTVYALVNENEWTVYFSLDLDAWGHYAFKPRDSSVASVTVPVAASATTIEHLSIYFEAVDDGTHMIIGWENQVVRVPIQV